MFPAAGGWWLDRRPVTRLWRDNAIAAFLLLSVTWGPGPTPGQFLAAGPTDTGCQAVADKRADPGLVRVNDAVTVTLGLSIDCGDRRMPYDVVLVIDRSASMKGGALDAAKAAALEFLDLVELGPSTVGVVSFADQATRESRLASEKNYVRSAISRLVADGGTNIEAGLREAGRLLEGGANPQPAIVLLTDGRNSSGRLAVRQQASLRRAAGALLITIALGRDADVELLREIATTPADAHRSPSNAELSAVYRRIADHLETLSARDIVIIDDAPTDMRLEAGSLKAGGHASGGRITWRLAAIPRTGVELDYVVRPQVPGLRPTNVQANATFRDSAGGTGAVDFPVPVVRVLGPDELPFVTPTPTPASKTATPAGTDPTPTPDGPTPAATPRPEWPEESFKAFLPGAYASACPVTHGPSDVIVVLDASTTMWEPQGDGWSKFDAAQSGIGRLAAALLPRSKRMALVVFNRDAAVAARFTSSVTEVEAALEQVVVRTGSRLDLGLRAAGELMAREARPEAVQSVILVSDGLPVGVGAESVIEAAARLWTAGVLTWSVSLGQGPGDELMRQIAAAPERYFDGRGDLGLALSGLAGHLDCRRGP